ncbi:hypothetical protein [Cohnella fermenti]|uniref:Cache domain-containing protein n=1 Tax=Cohnella fermenti TaxID=2565925 RepID=A0A4S4BH05_9BACL|nr:hypothetical protein [Cohnella fermenti]THF73748.1 hypothetical protein E6C55_28055 [Cohnella fermenti]
MFKRLDRNIQGVLLSVVFIYLVLSSWVVYRSMESRGTESLQRMSVQYTGQQHQNAELFKRWMEETVQIVVSRDGIRDALSRLPLDDTLQPQLDGLRASNVDMSSLVLYGKQGAVYSSGNITSLMTMDNLAEEPEIARYLASGQDGEWLALSAKSLYYPAGGGDRMSLFHFTRIKDRLGNDLGVLQFETSLPKLLGLFRSEANTIYGGNRPYLITEGGQWLGENGLPADVPEETKQEAARLSGQRAEAELKEGLLLVYALEHSADRIAIVIPDAGMKGELRKLGLILIGVGVAMALLFVWLIRKLSFSLTTPLQALYHKMRTTMKEPEGRSGGPEDREKAMLDEGKG